MTGRTIVLILARADNGVIGVDGRLPWHLPADLKRFRAMTMGKPMANGHPVAALATRPEIMAAFRDNFGYFNTFGGNPVSAAACLATLDVIEDEGLQENAAAVGTYLLDRLRGLRHPYLVQARGMSILKAGFVASVPAICGFAGGVLGGAVAEGRVDGSTHRAPPAPRHVSRRRTWTGPCGSRPR